MSCHEESSACEGTGHFFCDMVDGVWFKIQKHIATENEVHIVYARWLSGESIPEQIPRVERYHRTNVVFQRPGFVLFHKISLLQVRFDHAKRPLTIDALLCVLDGTSIDIGSQNVHLPTASGWKQLIHCHREWVSLFPC